jgi:K+ transporter
MTAQRERSVVLAFVFNGAWRRNLFIATSRLSTDAAESFCLPRDRTVIMGSRIEV